MHTFMNQATVKEMECTTKTLNFTVSRKIPELITPAEPTPYELKPLSDIDDQDGLRFHIPAIVIYGRSPSITMQGKDPVTIIRHAIAKALVFYYPYAGRLRETATRKLVVECSAEGVLFIEADADVTAQQFPLHPPFPNLDNLLYNVPGSDGVIDCPLILFQVTRLKCGGFILAFRFNHTMSDAAGVTQFVSAISEVAFGGEAPSIRPVWERHLLSARNPPCASFAHPEYDLVPGESALLLPLENMVERPFFFSAADISTLRRSLPPHFRSCSQFDLVAACVWRCRTLALSLSPKEEVRLLCAVNIRNRVNPPLPRGYYGNSVVTPMAVATAEELRDNPLYYITELLRKTKAKVTDKYVRSAVDVIVMKDRGNFKVDGSFVVSDLGRYGRLNELDFGWGKAAYGGVAKGCLHSIHGIWNWLVHCNNEKGENGIIVSICLPPNAMELFTKELKMVMLLARKIAISSASAL